MVKLKFLVTVLLLSCWWSSTAQLRSLEKGMDQELKDRLSIQPIPEKGALITAAIAGIPVKYLKWDYNVVTTMMVFQPAYAALGKDGTGIFSIGSFKNLSDAHAFCKRIRCLFQGAVPMVWEDGKRTSLEELKGSTLPEQKPDFDAATKMLDELIHTGFYRVQIGYYEQPGFTPDEQAVYDALVVAGVKLLELPYKNGRIYVTEKTYVTHTEATNASAELDDLVGRSTIIKPFGKPSFIPQDALERVYSCLKTGE
jgi:hypothetical protein